VAEWLRVLEGLEGLTRGMYLIGAGLGHLDGSGYVSFKHTSTAVFRPLSRGGVGIQMSTSLFRFSIMCCFYENTFCLK